MGELPAARAFRGVSQVLEQSGGEAIGVGIVALRDTLVFVPGRALHVESPAGDQAAVPHRVSFIQSTARRRLSAA